jgi:hypothetical protein
MNNFLSVFVGVPQSRYAAIAITIAIVIVSLIILVTKDTIPIGQKFGFIFLVFLVSLPSLALALFQLTCIVTGAGFKQQRWWCSAYAWIISLMMIFYSVILIVAAILSLTSPDPDTYSRRLTPSQFNDMMQSANNMTMNAMNDNMEIVQQPSDAYVMHHQTDTQVVHKQVVMEQPKPQHVSEPRVVVQQPSNLYPMQDPNMHNNENLSDLYPMKQPQDRMFRQDALTPSNYYSEPFVVNGGHSINASYPGSDMPVLPYVPGTEVNGSVLPMPTNSLIEKFYAGVEDDDDDDDDNYDMSSSGNSIITSSKNKESFIMSSE